MAIATRHARSVERPQTPPRHPPWEAVRKFVRTKPLGVAGASIIVLMTVSADNSYEGG